MAIDYIPYMRKMIGHERMLSVGLSALIINEKEEVLLEKRSDNGLYCLPGGSIDLDEKVKEGVIREVFEETGLLLKKEDLHLFMIKSGKEMEIVYPNGDVTDYCDLVFFVRVNSKDVTLKAQDEESTSISFVSLASLPKVEEMLRGTMEPIQKYLKKNFEVEVD
ncbi:MAG: NUDIX domain-containing protein [Bacilli bacterium]|nr:NUDIX domain-containing protein [Bacilli bacterium]